MSKMFQIFRAKHTSPLPPHFKRAPLRVVAVVILLLVFALSRIQAQADDNPVTRIASQQVFTGALDAVAFSPDGLRLASGGRDNSVRLWNAQSGENLRVLDGHSDWVTSIAFNGDGSRLVSGSRDQSVRVFDTTTGALLTVITAHNNIVNAVALTPDGRVVASGGRDGQIYLHTLDAQLVSVLNNFDQPVWDLAFSPDGKTLATASEDGVIWLWGLWHDDGTWLKKLVGHDDPVASIAYSADGDYLLSGGLDGTVRLWDLRELAVKDELSPMLVMRGHLAPIMGVGFTTDKNIALSASLDGTVRLWDVSGAIAMGQELSVITGNGAPLTHLALNPTGDAAASVGTDGVLNLWNMGEETVRTVIESNRPVTIVQNPPQQTTGNRAIPGVAALQDSSVQVMTVPTPQRETIAPQGNQTAAAALPAPSGGRTLHVPSAGINIGVKTFYLDGVSWAIDPWEPLAGHLQGTSWVDTGGNVVIGAHSEYPNGSAGAFRNLYNVGIGDEIFLRDGSIQRRYIVTNIRSVDYRDVSVVYPTPQSQITLFTCDIPSYVAEQNLYYERLVVVAQEVPL